MLLMCAKLEKVKGEKVLEFWAVKILGEGYGVTPKWGDS